MKYFDVVCKVIKNPVYIPSYWRKLIRELNFFNFDYKFLNSYSFPPKSICLIVTERCNLQCLMCDIGRSNVRNSSSAVFPLLESIRKGGEEMTIEDWKALVDDITQKRWTPLFLLTGTEPFLYPDILELIEYIVNKKLRLHITTNGVLLSSYASQLVDLCKKPDSITITISLDGIGEVHDTIRGVKGTFDKAIAGIKKINEKKKKHGKNWPAVSVTYTISNLNYQHMRYFVQWLQDENLGIRSINFSHLWFKDDEIVKNHNKEYGGLFSVRQENLTGLNLSDIDMDFVYRELRTLRKKHTRSSLAIFEHPRLTYEEARQYYSRTTELVFYDRCLAPWRNVSITPRGEVIISPMCFDYPLGNVKKDSFPHIWNDAPLRYFRKELKKAGVYPACARCCMLFDSRPKYYKLKERI